MAVAAGELIKQIGDKYLRSDLPVLEVGDMIKMRIKVKEADKIRSHPYDGTVIRITGGGVGSTFTVRKLSYGEGVERTFPTHSPMIENIQVVAKGKVCRAKLYYLRGRIGKKARVKKDLSR